MARGFAAVGQQHGQLQRGKAGGGGETLLRNSLTSRADGKDPTFSEQGRFALTRSTRIMGPW